MGCDWVKEPGAGGQHKLVSIKSSGEERARGEI